MHEGRIVKYETTKGPRWYVEWDDPTERTDSGRARKHKRRGYESAKAARAALRVFVSERADGKPLAGGQSPRLADWVADDWTDIYRRSGVKASTLATVGEYLKRITPDDYLGSVRVADLRPAHVDRWHAKLEAADLAPKTIRNVHNVLRRVMEDARRRGLTPTNPVLEVPPPRAQRSDDVAVLTRPQLDALVDHLASLDEPGLVLPRCVDALFSVLAFTGLRRGEALGLAWKDVDLEAGVVRVVASRTKYGLTEPKTRSGRRVVPVPPVAADRLRTWRADLAAHCLELGTHPPDLVFVDMFLEPIKPTWVTRTLPKLCAAAGVPPVTPHQLRHGWATLLAEGGVHPAVTAAMVGHSSSSFTMDRYTHVGDSHAAAEAQRVADRLSG